MFTIQRYDKSPGEGLKFASILGMPVTGSFELREEGSSTILAMQVKYQLPSLLGQFVGELPVWGDVDDMLTDALEEFKKLAEADA